MEKGAEMVAAHQTFLWVAAVASTVFWDSAGLALTGADLEPRAANPGWRAPFPNFGPGGKFTVGLEKLMGNARVWFSLADDQSFTLTPGLTLSGDLRQRLLDLGMHPYLEPRIVGQIEATYRGSVVGNRLEFFFDGVPVCNAEIKVYRPANVRADWVVSGIVPTSDASGLPEKKQWPEFSAIEGMIGQYGENWKVVRQSPCAFPLGDVLVAAWSATVTINDKPFKIITDGREILWRQPLFFATTSEATIFDPNPNGRLKAFSFTTDDSGYLQNDFFRTSMEAKTGARAKATDGKFDFSPISSPNEFAEVSAFVNANTMLTWFEEQGFNWWGRKPLEIKPFWSFNGNINNALYQPGEATTSGLPNILLAEGDGKALKHLLLDSDVISHEFAHHVAFSHYKATTGNALIVHEGLADFFTFLRTQDTCLGESICPSGSGICWSNQCLRTAKNELTYGSEEYNRIPAHQQGQAISGLLWDFYSKGLVSDDAMAGFMIQTIALLNPLDDFSGFFSALIEAEKIVFNGQYKCQLVEVIVARSFQKFVLNAKDCGVDSGQSAGQKKKSSSCGTLGIGQSKTSTWYGGLMFVIMVVPLLRVMRVQGKR